MKKIIFVPDITNKYAEILRFPELDSSEQSCFTLYYLPESYKFPTNKPVHMFDYYLANCDFAEQDWEKVWKNIDTMMQEYDMSHAFVVIDPEAFVHLRRFENPYRVRFIHPPKTDVETVRNARCMLTSDLKEANFEIKDFLNFAKAAIWNFATIVTLADHENDTVELIGSLSKEDIANYRDFDVDKDLLSRN